MPETDTPIDYRESWGTLKIVYVDRSFDHTQYEISIEDLYQFFKERHIADLAGK